MIDLKTRPTIRRACAALIGLSFLGAAAPGWSQALEPAAAIAVRRDAYREIGTAFKSLNDELKKPKPLPVVMTRSAATVAKTSRRMPNWFPAGSGPSAGIKTAAKPEIWSRRAEFDAIQNKLIADAGKLEQLVAAGDTKAIAAQVRVVGGSCKSCHDKFRTPED